MLRTSSLLSKHAHDGKVIFGVNFSMRDYSTSRNKKLDLVVARHSSSNTPSTRSLADLAEDWKIVLTDSQKAELTDLPPITEGEVTGSGVLIALEAKAAMTAHSKARPRLYDELNSSHSTIHGASNQALAVGLAMVNASEEFISPPNQSAGKRDNVSIHKQPAAAETTIEKLEELPRRSSPYDAGFDGLGIVVVKVKNDGSPIELVAQPPAPQSGEVFYYDDMISRVSNEYDSRFSAI